MKDDSSERKKTTTTTRNGGRTSATVTKKDVAVTKVESTLKIIQTFLLISYNAQRLHRLIYINYLMIDGYTIISQNFY